MFQIPYFKVQSCCNELHVTHVVLHVGKENCFCTASRQRCLKCMIPQLTCDSFFPSQCLETPL